MDIKEKLKMLRKLSEVDLTKNFLIPLYESNGMGCKNVRYTHRRLEFGKDVIYYKEDEYGNRLFTGVQVKKTKITTGNIDNILRQVSEAFGEQFTDLGNGKKENLGRVVVLTSGEFLEEAKDSFWASLKGSNLDRLVTCIDGNQLVRLLDKHMPSAFWDEYDYFDKYFKSMRADFETIRDISAIGQKEHVRLDKIYVSLKLTEEAREQQIPIEQEWKIFEEELSESEREEVETREIRTKVLDAEKALEDYERLVIVGVPGSGKTTLLKYLALKACRDNLDRQERACVPIPITLRQLVEEGKDLRSYIDDVFEKYEFSKAKEFVEKDLKEGRCSLLLDGFDELATKENQDMVAEEIEGFIKKYPKTSVVVTSRVAGYQDELKGFSKLELMEFDDRQIERFIENWFGQRDPERAKSMFSAIKENERITVLARNPLMISIIAIIYEEDRELPQRRSDLYKRCVEVLLSKWDVQKRIRNKYPSEKKEFILRKLAFYGHSNNKRILTETEILEEMVRHFAQIGLKERDAKGFLDEIWKRSYLLRQVSMERYDFLHLSFQEYFTALELKEKEDGLATIIQNLHKPWWEEPILLYAGISRDASALIKAIEEKTPEDIFCSNLMLFGKCVADAEFTDLSIRKTIVYKLWGIYRTDEFKIIRERAIGVLALIKPDELIGTLIRNLKKRKGKDTYVRLRSTTTLGLLRSEKAVGPLLETLEKDEDSEIRWRAASALGMIASEKAVEALLEALSSDENSEVRGRAASALGMIASEKAVEELLEALSSDENSEVRGRAASALGMLVSEKSVEALLEALTSDENSEVRWRAVSALGSIASEKAIEPLIEALARDKNSKVRRRAASALIKISSDKVVELLLELLMKGTKGYVRGISAFVLGQIGNDEAIEALMEALGGDDKSEVRAMAASALGRIGSYKSIEPLLEALGKDDTAEVRAQAASALGRIGSEKAIEPLLEVMYTCKESNVRAQAASALGRIGSEKAVETMLEALGRDDTAEVRAHAALALGHIGSEKEVEPLMKALTTDESNYVRECVARTLRLIGSEKAVEPLMKALATDESNYVKKYAAKSLGSIGSEKAVEPLMKALANDKDSFVRGRSAESLGLIASKKAIETLKKALEDEGEYFWGKVKDVAFAALEKTSRRTFIRITY